LLLFTSARLSWPHSAYRFTLNSYCIVLRWLYHFAADTAHASNVCT